MQATYQRPIRTKRRVKDATHLEHFSRAVGFARAYFAAARITLPWDRIEPVLIDMRRGRCKSRQFDDGLKFMITIPLWTLYDYLDPRGCLEYCTYYVIHELCHVYTKENLGYMGHNEDFYKVFAKVCPREWHHNELRYKPSAARYGVGPALPLAA